MSTHIEPGGPALSDLALVWARTRSVSYTHLTLPTN